MRRGGNTYSVSLVANPSITGRLAKVNPLLHINIEDVAVTKEIVTAGRLLSIEVLDHLVIGKQRYVSMRERGLGF